MDGQPPGGWIPARAAHLEQALCAFTRGAAYAGFAEDRLGALDPGNRPTSSSSTATRPVDPQSSRATQVLETWIAGKNVWERAP